MTDTEQVRNELVAAIAAGIVQPKETPSLATLPIRVKQKTVV